MSRRLGALALALVMLWPAVVWPDVITYPARTTIAATLNVNSLCLDAANQDTCLVRDGAADTLALKRGANAQTFRVYRDATDYGTFGWEDGHLVVKGTGAYSLRFYTNSSFRWAVDNSGHFTANSDNTYDVGATAANRPRSLYLGTSLAIDGGARTASQVEINRWVVKASGLEINVASGLTLNNVVSVPGTSTGTLTNAPGATDPNVWIPIIVNGVVRKIPAW